MKPWFLQDHPLKIVEGIRRKIGLGVKHLKFIYIVTRTLIKRITILTKS